MINNVRKGQELYLKIGEVAAMYEISAKALRIYDRCGLLKPVFIDQESGYRYYSPNQLNRLAVILNLKKVGFSLKEIAEFFNGSICSDALVRIFQYKHSELQKEVDTLQYNMELIDEMISSVNQGSLVQDQLSDKEKAILLSRVTCLENAKLEHDLTQILWL